MLRLRPWSYHTMVGMAVPGSVPSLALSIPSKNLGRGSNHHS